MALGRRKESIRDAAPGLPLRHIRPYTYLEVLTAVQPRIHRDPGLSHLLISGPNLVRTCPIRESPAKTAIYAGNAESSVTLPGPPANAASSTAPRVLATGPSRRPSFAMYSQPTSSEARRGRPAKRPGQVVLPHRNRSRRASSRGTPMPNPPQLDHSLGRASWLPNGLRPRRRLQRRLLRLPSRCAASRRIGRCIPCRC